jgi:shikimate dehydrogenase
MNIIHGTTRTCGLIGNPVGHSISPVIHNMLADICGTDLVYTTFKVEKDDVVSAVKGAYALNILGLNVTVPHKQAVMETLVDIDPLAKAIGAVNTLQRADGGYKGYNTDILGLERELEDENVELKGSNAVILGAGGAARAIAFLCASKSPASVTILNRTLEKAQNIADAVNSYFNSDIAKADTIDRADRLPFKDYVVIQATSVGLYPNVDDVPVTATEFYENAKVGVDIIYNPYTTKFMKLMQEHGKPAYNGLKMLLYQGVAAFEIWNGCKVSKEMAEKVYVAMKEALGINE